MSITTDMPALTVTEHGERVRLSLGGFAHGDGASLQEAADDLIGSVLRLALALREGGFRSPCGLRPDLDTLNFLSELAEIAATGGDIRARVFA